MDQLIILDQVLSTEQIEFLYYNPNSIDTITSGVDVAYSTIENETIYLNNNCPPGYNQNANGECQIVTCSLSITNGNDLSSNYGESASVSCDSKHTASVSSVNCQIDGSYDVPSVSCNSGCSAAPINNSSLTQATNISHGGTLGVECSSGYSGNGTLTCDNGTISGSFSCTPNSCDSTQVANSNMSGSGSIAGVTGDAVNVLCDQGYTGGGTATCQTSGDFTSVSCTADACSPTQVPNSNMPALEVSLV